MIGGRRRFVALLSIGALLAGVAEAPAAASKKRRRSTSTRRAAPRRPPGPPVVVLADPSSPDDAAVGEACRRGLGSLQGSALAMDPHTGRVIAVVNPSLGVERAYQPCSVFKVVVALADPRARTLCLQVCELHLLVRKLGEVRAGTLAALYDRHFRAKDFPLDLFALAVAADCAGRLGKADEGERVRVQVTADVAWLCERGRSVDAGALKQQHPDLERFKAALHEARARAMAAGVPSANAPS